MRTLVVVSLLILLAACAATPPTLPDPVTVSFRTYYGTAGGAQQLVLVDVLANQPVTVTINAHCHIDEGGIEPISVRYQGTVTLETQGADRAIGRLHDGRNLGPGTIACEPMRGNLASGVSVSITER